MELMTKEIAAKMPAIGSTGMKKAENVPVICKFFDPEGSWTWYVTEGDMLSDGWLFFGYVRGTGNELGYFSELELKSYKGNIGLGIERDEYFGKHTLREVMAEAL